MQLCYTSRDMERRSICSTLLHNAMYTQGEARHDAIRFCLIGHSCIASATGSFRFEANYTDAYPVGSSGYNICEPSSSVGLVNYSQARFVHYCIVKPRPKSCRGCLCGRKDPKTRMVPYHATSQDPPSSASALSKALTTFTSAPCVSGRPTQSSSRLTVFSLFF